jgi:thioredoxin 1
MSDGSSTKQVKIARFVVALLIIVGVGAVAGNLIYINWLKKEPAATAMSSSMTLLNIPRPDFTLRDLDGIPRTVSAWDGKVLVINFWATWCKPCQMVAPVLDELAKEYDGRVDFLKLDVDHNQQTAAKYNVMSIPTIMVFKGGQPVSHMVGFSSKANLKRTLEDALA